MPAVRLFIGNLPYNATEEDIRTHFATVAPPTQIVRPLDRETGRARGFAFVEYGERTHAEEAIKRFDGQLFMGRPLAVSEARARDDRGPSAPRPGRQLRPPRPAAWAPVPGAPRPGGYAPRPPGEGGYGGRPGRISVEPRRPAADRRRHRPAAQLRAAGAAQGQEGAEAGLRAEGTRTQRPDSDQVHRPRLRSRRRGRSRQRRRRRRRAARLHEEPSRPDTDATDTAGRNRHGRRRHDDGADDKE